MKSKLIFEHKSSIPFLIPKKFKKSGICVGSWKSKKPVIMAAVPSVINLRKKGKY